MSDLNLDAPYAVEKPLEPVESNADHVFVPIAVDFDLDYRLDGV